MINTVEVIEKSAVWLKLLSNVMEKITFLHIPR